MNRLIGQATHTVAELQVSPAAYKEIRALLERAGYGDVIDRESGLIDLQGIGITPDPAYADCHKSDTPERVCFYEQDHYYLSNFSAFRLEWKGISFATSEQAYQWEKFPGHPDIRDQILYARSAHDAFKVAEARASEVVAFWYRRKLGVMKEILREKAQQHSYVMRKLLSTGERYLVEDSWRDGFWGDGDGEGLNKLGKLWMEIRRELRA